ncbi:type IX secretion system anionic LPS delivery protein PorZ [Pontibacter sp. MBLB2868]|uniref:type IX secretion system anionic LPS delivery protein PorZ n=1 Tax=Pontibacter sp. MBLB2868 TaxID=3451555 RepID=UPI003F7528F3
MGATRRVSAKSCLHKLKCRLYICLLFFCGTVYGQSNVPLGSWRVHAPYRQGIAVADAADKVYVAAERGLFYYDKEFNTTQAISKVDGLREQQISTIAYDSGTKTLVVAYANTNLDLIRDDKITNISDIFRKAISGEKLINHINIYNKQAYISSTFGVVVLDLVKLEIRDTYMNLGPNGEIVNVKSSAILGDSIFLATNMGVLGAKRQGVNLQDFHSWGNLSAGLPLTGASEMVAFNEKLFATTNNGLFSLSGKKWSAEPWAANNNFNAVTASVNYLSLTSDDKVMLLDKSGKVRTLSNALLTSAKEAVVGNSEDWVWVADNSKGLVRLKPDGSDAAAFAPDGPYSSDSFRVYANNGSVYVLSGGFSEVYLNNGSWNGFYVFSEGEWKSFNKYVFPTTSFVKGNDIVDAVFNPVTEKLYLASYGAGLIEWGGPDNSKLYNGYNSPLLSALSSADKEAYVRVTDVAVDTDGSVWVVNRNYFSNSPGLHELRPDGSWKSFVLPNFADGSNLDQVLIDDYGRKWLSIARRSNKVGGLVVFDETENKLKHLSIGEGAGGLPNADVYALTKDLNGDIWVGTAAGVGVYYNPGIVFSESRYDARVPIIDRRPLLDGQVVRSIAVDGANRKWMATDNGLWLFNPDGDKLIHHFTASNSPLPSDKVLSVAVEHKTGDVFVATDAGVASYRAEATITEATPECAVVFPNPVSASYTGLVGVSGLPNNADVRITDVAGALVYKTKATGGTLAWDARDYNGKRVKAGVYLVMSSSEDGQQTCISKIAVLD